MIRMSADIGQFESGRKLDRTEIGLEGASTVGVDDGAVESGCELFEKKVGKWIARAYSAAGSAILISFGPIRTNLPIGGMYDWIGRELGRRETDRA